MSKSAKLVLLEGNEVFVNLGVMINLVDTLHKAEEEQIKNGKEPQKAFDSYRSSLIATLSTFTAFSQVENKEK